MFRVKVKTFGIARWILMREVPKDLKIEEWLYLDKAGVPIIYWNAGMKGVMLI